MVVSRKREGEDASASHGTDRTDRSDRLDTLKYSYRLRAEVLLLGRGVRRYMRGPSHSVLGLYSVCTRSLYSRLSLSVSQLAVPTVQRLVWTSVGLFSVRLLVDGLIEDSETPDQSHSPGQNQPRKPRRIFQSRRLASLLLFFAVYFHFPLPSLVSPW